MFQEDFGARLRELRLAKGLTKEDFCNGDELLCVRQLTRLETGKSQPKLETLTLLAQRLEMTVSELIGETETKTELPAEYLKLKYQLIRTPTYQNLDIIDDLEQSLEIIFSKYYDWLPKEEQEIVDILQSAIYTTESDGEYFGENILLKYKNRLESVPYYSVTDLFVLHLYKSYIDEDDVLWNGESEFFHKISERLLNSISYIPVDYLFLLRDLLIMIPTVEVLQRRFNYTNQAFEALAVIVKLNQDFQKEPIVKMLKWKYALASKKYEEAEKYYEESLMYAELFANQFLVEKLSSEWEKDKRLSDSINLK